MIRSVVFGLGLALLPLAVRAQQPTPEQAEGLLQTRPDLVARVREWIGTSGLTPEQIRSRLTAAGYPENLLDPYLSGRDSTGGPPAAPNARTLQALRSLGIAGPDELPPVADTV